MMKLSLLFKRLRSVFSINNLKHPINKITTLGIKISFVGLLFSALLMALYIDNKAASILFEASSALLHSFSTFIVFFLIMGFSFNRIKAKK